MMVTKKVVTRTVSMDYFWKGEEVKILGKKVVNKSAYETGLVIERQAKLLAARNWGYLAASITTLAADGKGTEPGNPTAFQQDTPYGKPASLSTDDMQIQAPTDANTVFVGTPVDYAWWVEFGTSKQRAQPFLRPALDLAKGKVLTIVENNGRLEFKEYLK